MNEDNKTLKFRDLFEPIVINLAHFHDAAGDERFFCYFASLVDVCLRRYGINFEEFVNELRRMSKEASKEPTE